MHHRQQSFLSREKLSMVFHVVLILVPPVNEVIPLISLISFFFLSKITFMLFINK